MNTRQHLKNLLQNLVPNVSTIVIVAFMLFAYTAWAAPERAPAAQGSTPGVISYQGTLTDDAGQPINSNVDMTFRLYDQPTNGTTLWTETHTGGNAVPVQSGFFHVLLGSLTPIPSTVWSNYPLYLGVQVGTEPEMTPREMVGAVPMAMTVPDGSITTQKLSDGAVGSSQLAGIFGSSAAPLSNVIIQPWGSGVVGDQVAQGTYTLDLTEQTSSTASAVILQVSVQDENAWDKVFFFYPGETNGAKKQKMYAQSAANTALMIVPCDSSQQIEYETSANIDSLSVKLVGWIEPAK